MLEGHAHRTKLVRRIHHIRSPGRLVSDWRFELNNSRHFFPQADDEAAVAVMAVGVVGSNKK